MKRGETGEIVGAYDLFRWAPGATVAEYVKTFYDVEKGENGRLQIHYDGLLDPESEYSIFASYGPENVVLPKKTEPVEASPTSRADGDER